MKHLCIFDMDDTLLATDKSVSFDNMQAIKKLQELGIGVTIATGRSGFLVGKYIELLAIDQPIITCNGGLVVEPNLTTIIWENVIETTQLQNLFQYLYTQKADFLAYSNNMIYCSPGSASIHLFEDYNKTVAPPRQAPITHLTADALSQPLPDIVKILLYHPTAEQIAYLKNIAGLEVLASMSHVLDIMQSGSTKGRAVQALAQHLQVPLKNVAVFGDNENDISMLTCGALGIAMGNSKEEIKKHARYVTGDCNNSGVAQGIYEYVLPHFGFKNQ